MLSVERINYYHNDH